MAAPDSLLVDAAPSPPAVAPGRTLQVQLRGAPVARERAWRLVGDTDWLNRVAGSPPLPAQEIALEADGLPVVVGLYPGPVGTQMPYREIWTSWAVGQYFRQVREISHPLLRRMDYHARLLDAGPGLAVPEITLALTAAALLTPALWLQTRHLQRRWQVQLDALAAPPASVRALPAAARIALGTWAQRTDRDLVAAFGTLLQSEPPSALRRLRAFALADRWGLPREQVLETMLHGVEAGALELYWSVRCDRCHGQLSASALLSDLPDHINCPTCRVGTGTDLGATVEALFAPHPAVVPRSREQFCTLYPAASPEMFGVFTLAPGQTLQQTLHLPPGRWRLGPGGETPDLLLETMPAAAGLAPAPLCWHPQAAAAGGIVARPAGPVTLSLENDPAARRRLYLIQAERRDDRVLAAMVSNHPRFRAQMGHQALSLDQRTTIRSVALLFTDLSGSTALYEAMGDAQAFALVRDHFQVLRDAAAAHRGVVVKTIGDAVMVSFTDPADAVRCALEMQAQFGRWAAARPQPLPAPLLLKVGLHVGTALAVQSDAAGLDWFGSAVNLAARTESAAHGGQILWTRAVQEHPAVQAVLHTRNLQPTPMERQLKGLREPVTLYWLTPAIVSLPPPPEP